jgi:hypothetical protein
MSVGGTWKLTIDSPMGKQQMSVDFTQHDGDLSGVMVNQANNMSTEIFDGRVDGDRLAWKAKLRTLNLTLAFTTLITDDVMSGTVKAGLFGNFEVAGTRG